MHLAHVSAAGMLALSYAAQKGGNQAGVLSVTCGSVAPSYKQLVSDRQGAAQQLLGAQGADTLAQANLTASSSSSDAAAAWQQYQQQYVCRFPAAQSPGGCASRASQQRSQPVFDGLAGGQYFAAAGSLANWSLDGIDTAALQVCLRVLFLPLGVWCLTSCCHASACLSRHARLQQLLRLMCLLLFVFHNVCQQQ